MCGSDSLQYLCLQIQFLCPEAIAMPPKSNRCQFVPPPIMRPRLILAQGPHEEPPREPTEDTVLLRQILDELREITAILKGIRHISGGHQESLDNFYSLWYWSDRERRNRAQPY